MATIRDYLEIAEASYQSDAANHVGSRWSLRKSEKATWYGNGFQGSVFESEQEVIVAFSGTKGGPLSAPISQNSANARIGAHIIPNMAGAAKKLVRWAEQNCAGKPVSIVGHSLGGALAQVVGAWSGRPFVSLNGPGMETHLKASSFNIFKPRQMARSIKARRKNAPAGLCLNVRGDFVGGYGKGYVGEVQELTPSAGEPTHSIDSIRNALTDGDLAKQPWMLSAAWPATRISATVPRLGNVPSSGPILQELIAQAGPPSHRPPGPARPPIQAAARAVRLPARPIQPPSGSAEPSTLDEDYDRLIGEVDGWLDSIGEGAKNDGPVSAAEDTAERNAWADKWAANGAWLTSTTGISPESLENLIGEVRGASRAPAARSPIRARKAME